MARLKDIYHSKIVPQLQKELKIKNVMAVPKITKITLNMGVGKGSKDKKIIDFSSKDLEAISGQKTIITKTKKSIAGFKIREGWPIGVKTTLRRNKMFEFLDRLISIAIPRIRDFRGLSVNSFDGQGNYNMGIKEQIAFPEIDYDKINEIRGMDISITTTAKNDAEGIALLRLFKFPLKK